jgi:hypothetical protein
MLADSIALIIEKVLLPMWGTLDRVVLGLNLDLRQIACDKS